MSKVYFFSGGGSGGHLTPLIAVAEALKEIEPTAEIHAIVHRGDGLNSLVIEHPSITKVHGIFAGKLRRYHGSGEHISLREVFKNIRDMFYLAIGFIQSFWLILRWRPKVLFMRGGYVGVPLGFAARLLRKAYVTHDSDAVASLANRLISGGAKAHAVSASKEHYAYAKDKIHEVGVPINKLFKPMSADDKKAARVELELPKDAEVVLITGGGLGAARLNNAVAKSFVELLEARPKLVLLHLAGQSQQEHVQKLYGNQKRALVYGFRKDLVSLSIAADVVITRAGATAMAEFAAQGKPMIIVPNPLLTGGHQLHNALAYQQNGAAIVVDEKDMSNLGVVVSELLDNPEKSKDLGSAALKLARPNAAADVASLLIRLGESVK